MHYSNIILFVVGAINLLLSFFVYLRNKRSKINVFFAITIFSISAWCFGIALFRMATPVTVYFWGQFVYFAVSFTIIFFLYFSFFFPFGKFPNNKLVKTILFITPIVVFITTIIPRSIIAEAIFHGGGQIDVKVGWGYYVHSAVTFLFMGWAFINLILKFKKSTGVARLQLLYLFLGTIISTTIAVITNLLLFFYTTAYNWVGPTGTIIMVLFIAYAITRYRLMDIRLVVIRTITFGFIIVILTSVYAVFSVYIGIIFERWIGIDDNTSNIIISIIVAILVVAGYGPLRKVIEKLTNRFLYKKTYNPEQLLNQITDVASSILDIEHLLTSICATLDEAFHAQKIGIALLNKNKNLEIAYKKDFKPGAAEGLVGFPGAVQALYKELKLLGGMLVIDEMKTRFENGEFKPANPGLLVKIYEQDIALIIPLYVKEQLIGIIALGNKKSGDPYNYQDLKTLRIIGGQAAIAIENARLYDELKDFSGKMEEQVKEKTAELRKANEELMQLDEAKSEFISIASHQLRTPLTVIKGYISMMREGSFGEISPVVMKHLEKVYLSNERLIGLVENLLDISRIESGRQKFDWNQVQLDDLAKTVVDNMKKNAKDKKLKLFFHVPKKKLPKVIADPNKIHEVMMNFVDNAIKYTLKGKINVSLAAEPKGAVTFYVEDTGKGISEDIRPYLFQKFSRGKDSFRLHTEGVGLGLYVAKMIIDSHHGKVWAESEGKDKGSKFCFSLPINNLILEKEIKKN